MPHIGEMKSKIEKINSESITYPIFSDKKYLKNLFDLNKIKNSFLCTALGQEHNFRKRLLLDTDAVDAQLMKSAQNAALITDFISFRLLVKHLSLACA